MYARMVIGEAISDGQVLEFAQIYASDVLPGLAPRTRLRLGSFYG